MEYVGDDSSPVQMDDPPPSSPVQMEDASQDERDGDSQDNEVRGNESQGEEKEGGERERKRERLIVFGDGWEKVSPEKWKVDNPLSKRLVSFTSIVPVVPA